MENLPRIFSWNFKQIINFMEHQLIISSRYMIWGANQVTRQLILFSSCSSKMVLDNSTMSNILIKFHDLNTNPNSVQIPQNRVLICLKTANLPMNLLVNT